MISETDWEKSYCKVPRRGRQRPARPWRGFFLLVRRIAGSGENFSALPLFNG